MTLVDNMSNNIVTWAGNAKIYFMTFIGNVNVYDIREFGDYDFDTMVKYLALPSTKVLMHTTGHEYHDCDQRAYGMLLCNINLIRTTLCRYGKIFN